MERKEKTILISLVANVILIALRFFLANISGSIGLAANAWHSLTDVFVTSVVFVGLLVARIGAKKLRIAAKKTENILAIFVSLFIFYMGVEILSDALGNNATELKYVPFVAAGAFVGVIINYFMARYKIYVGEQTNSESLKADGYHSKMDMYCSIAVLVGLLGSLFGMGSLDKIAAIVAMVMMLIAGYEILVPNAKALLRPGDANGDDEHQHHAHFKGGKKVFLTAGAVLAAAWLLSGVYFVQWDEVGVVRRFGAAQSDAVPPGIHYRLPSPIGQVTLVQKDNIQKVSTGGQELLTGDTNLINVDMSVHYKVSDPKAYALNVNNLESLVRVSAAASIRTIVGRETIDYLLTDGKTNVEQAARSMLQEVMDKNNTGIKVVGVQLVGATPPDSVYASFQDLASARQDRSIYINEATAYKNTILPKANADAYTQISEAEAYKDEKIKTAEGDAALFSQRQSAYTASRDVTEFRLYMEAMDKILPNVQKILLGSDVNINNAELWITNDNGGAN
jgi:membrane protease subunit HflK